MSRMDFRTAAAIVVEMAEYLLHKHNEYTDPADSEEQAKEAITVIRDLIGKGKKKKDGVEAVTVGGEKKADMPSLVRELAISLMEDPDNPQGISEEAWDVLSKLMERVGIKDLPDYVMELPARYVLAPPPDNGTVEPAD